MTIIGNAVAGVEVGKRRLDVALLVDGKLKTKALASTPAGQQELLEWVRKQKVAPEAVHFCVTEGEPKARFVACDLFDAGLHVSFVTAGDVRTFADAEGLAARADRLGADVVARYCAARRPEAWAAPSKQSRTIDAIREQLAALEGYRETEMRRADEFRSRGADTLAERALAHVAWLDESIAKFRTALAELIELGSDAASGHDSLA